MELAAIRTTVSRKTWTAIGIIAAILIAFAIILRWMGRIYWCECGPALGTTEAWSSETSQHLIDPYSTSHVLHGIIFFAVLWFFRKKISIEWRLIIAILLEVAWEVFENSSFIINRYRTATASLDYFGDSILNSIGDVLCTMFGFWLASKLPWKWTLILVIIIELIMLGTIKDNLTLNVLMLLYPVQAIREWQMAR